MTYLIDGHNLIPKLPGMSLQAMDDEQQLIQILQEFCRLQRKQVEVYFDNAPPGGMAVRKYGLVTAHFVRQGQTADDAIRARLIRLGSAAKSWTVVSSDQAVQASAKAARARFLSSEAFSHQLTSALDDVPPEPGKDPNTRLDTAEIEHWLQFFDRKTHHG